VKKNKKMKILKFRKKIRISIKSKNKKADLFRLKKNIIFRSTKAKMNEIIISIKAQNMIIMRKNMSQSLLKKLMMILILMKINKITDFLLQGILQEGSSEVHLLIQEELQLDLEAIFHLKD